MEERNVTRAGQRIGLAQPSMSSALTRLRALFGDELFVRSASGMQPTAKALALARPISDALGQIRGVLEPASCSNPATAHRRLSIAATDYGDLVVVPRLVGALRREAPGIDLTVRPIIDLAESVASLERGDVDALIGGHLPASARIIRSPAVSRKTSSAFATPARQARMPDSPATTTRVCRTPCSRPPAATGFLARSTRCWPARTQAPDCDHARPRRRGAVCRRRHRSRGHHGRAHRAPLRDSRRRGCRSASLRSGAFTIELLHTRRAMADPALRWFIEMVDRVCKSI